jgi:hypothetical protein
VITATRKKSTRGNTDPEREREREKKKDVASTAFGRKGTVIHR